MAITKMDTAADRYRRIKAEKEKGEQLHEMTCECTMPWKVRKLSMDFWVTSGILPMNLVQSMVKATQKQGLKPEKLLKEMAMEEVFQSVAFMSKVVTHTAVEPRIVETVKDANDIAQEEVMTCCYHALFNWQMKGGESSQLETFRQG